MKQIRRNVFETNSSSTHSINICVESDYDAWISGTVYLNEHSGWGSHSIYKKKTFVTKKEAIDILTKSDYPPLRDLTTLGDDELKDYFRDNRIYTYDNYNDEYLTSYSKNFTTPNGDKIVAFGKYGYDG